MNPPVEQLSWPASKLGDALDLLAERAGAGARQGIRSQRGRPGTMPRRPAMPKSAGGDLKSFRRWFETAVRHYDLEAEQVSSRYRDIDAVCHGRTHSGPGVFGFPVDGRTSSSDGELQFLVVLGVDPSRGHRSPARMSILSPDNRVCRVDADEVRSCICREVEAPHEPVVDRILKCADVPRRQRSRVRSAILRERLAELRVEPPAGGWLLRSSPDISFAKQVAQARLPKHLAVVICAHTILHLLGIAGWYVVGRGALQGNLDPAWLIAWALALFSTVPLRLLVLRSQGFLAFGLGGLLKKRLLHGALKFDPQKLRHQGVGQLLGRVIESEAVETLALAGGFMGILAMVEVVAAVAVLSLGSSGGWQVSVFLGWIGVVAVGGVRFYRNRKRWTASRLAMTEDLTERMVGHRTRLAQESSAHWHDGEDEAMRDYLELSRKMDRSAALLMGVSARGWLVIGLIGLAPAMTSGGSSATELAVGLGGVLLALRAITKIVGSFTLLVDAGISWQQIAPLFRAAASEEDSHSGVTLPSQDRDRDESPDDDALLTADDLVFRYRDRGDAVLRGCSLTIRTGERLLLEGPSGGGKSTLASVLFGLRSPESGLLLLRGLDRNSLGDRGWRELVTAAPQFHENYIFTGTLAFNLLMGRRWPASPDDLHEAETIFRELGLGELLDRMPAGLQQMLGETGWQLSHGEKSRLYIARTLLQGSELIILDESFAALDPETLRRCMSCVIERARTLMVIAHP